jgi:tetratricopeptide (TPR) repeat protein
LQTQIEPPAFSTKRNFLTALANSIHLPRVLLLEFQRRPLLVTFAFGHNLPVGFVRRTFLVHCFGSLLLVFSLQGFAAAQSPPVRGNPQKQAGSLPQRTPPAPDALQQRLEEAASARESGNPDSIARANLRVIALALHQFGNLRAVEGAFPQAIELYHRSLDLEDSADTHVALAITYLYANRPDDSLAEAAKALLAEPNNARAFNIQGKAWMKKRDYPKAISSLARSVELHPDFEAAYALGTCFLSLKDPESKQQAAEVFSRIVESVGDSGSLHVLFGRAYRNAEMVDDAIRELRRAVALDTRTPHAHYFLGLSLLWKNEWTDTPEIRQEFVTELHNFPRDFLANYFLGYLDSNDRRYEEANLHLNAAKEIDPSWPEPWLFLGLNAYAQGNLQQAESFLLKSVELTGKDESRGSYQVRRAYITLGRILTASGRAAEAAPYLDRARELQNKSLAEAQQFVAGKAADEGAVSAAAVVALLDHQDEEKVATSDQPVDPSAPLESSVLLQSGLSEEKRKAAENEENRFRLILGTSFNDLATSEAVRRNYSSALSHYQESERWDPSIPGLLRNLGVAAFRAQNYPEAIRALSAALVENPSDNPVRAMLGSAYFASDDYVNVVKTISPLGERAMRDPAVGYSWAVSLARLGDLKQATQVLQEYQKSDLSLDAILLVGQLWADMTDYARAVETFHNALDRDPSSMKAHYYAGLALVRWEHSDEAAEEFKAALNLSPDDPDAKNGLAFVYLEHGKQAEAAELFRSVVASHPENGNANYQLGKILLDGGSVKEAIAHLEVAAHALPQSDYVHYQLQAAYRKDSRIEDADRELQLYKELKARNRQASIPRPMPDLQ